MLITHLIALKILLDIIIKIVYNDKKVIRTKRRQKA